MVNKVILLGNVGRDPESRTLANGGRVVNFSLATSESWRDRNTGERKERSEWHQITIWNEALGKIAKQYLKKGSKVYLEGQIQTREFTDKDGNQRKTTEIVLPKFGGALELLGEKGGAKSEASAPSESFGRSGGSLSAHLDDDIPFAPEWR